MAKLVKCKTCQNEVAKNAKRCPHCGAKRKSGTWLVVIGVLLLVVAISSILGGEDEGPRRVEDGSQAAASTISTKPEEKTDTTFGVGDKVELKDIIVTMTGVKEHEGTQYNQPKDGNVFLLCSFEVENNSSSKIVVSSLLSFSAYVDGYATNLSLSAAVLDDATQMDGEIAAGKKMRGEMGYEVPADWSEIEIAFTPDFWSGKDIVFLAEK